MILRETSERKTRKEVKKVWKWGTEEIEEVEKFNYLGNLLVKNNKDIEHIKNQAAKAQAIMSKIWSVGERYMQENWKERMSLFKVVIRSIAFYRVEIWGWSNYKTIEILQKIYLVDIEATKKHSCLYIEKRN